MVEFGLRRGGGEERATYQLHHLVWADHKDQVRDGNLARVGSEDPADFCPDLEFGGDCGKEIGVAPFD